MVLKLALPDSAAAADSILRAEQDAEEARTQAINELRRCLERQNIGEPESLMRALQRLRKRKLPKPIEQECDARKAIDRYRDAHAIVESAWEVFRQVFESAVTKTSQTLHEVARTNRFREAVIWQNRRALHTGIDSLLKKSQENAPRGSKVRQYEEMVASYLQRYCTKNETIGFFGPVGWAKLVSAGPPISAQPGPSLLARREVYFEGWCIDALADSISRRPSMRGWLVARRMPYVRLDGLTLYQPMERPCLLSAQQAAVLGACDGSRTVNEIARLLIAGGEAAPDAPEQVYEWVEQLESKRVISLGLEVPMVADPEAALRRMLEKVEEREAREAGLAALDELERARRGVEASAGEAEKLDEALEEFERVYRRLTGGEVTRSAGRSYAGRTLLYEDCLRDIEVEIGVEVVEELSEAMGMLLTSARWFTAKVGEAYRGAFKEVYEVMARQRGVAAVEAVEFWLRAQRLVLGKKGSLVGEVEEEFQRRWERVLGVRGAERRERYSSDEVKWKVEEEFGGEKAGWRSGRYHSPDVMIAAKSVEGIRGGEYMFILGELHIGANTLGAGSFLQQHPSREELFEAVELDMPYPRVLPVFSKNWPNTSARTNLGLLSSRDYWLEASPNSPSPDERMTLKIADLVVEERGGGLVVRRRDGTLSFDIIDFFGETLNSAVLGRFKILSWSEHRPRVTIDRLVVCRETWGVMAEEADFARERDEAKRFVEARRWAEERGMPRFVFVKVPTEVKPFYVDFDSPVYVSMLAKMIRRVEESATGEGVRGEASDGDGDAAEAGGGVAAGRGRGSIHERAPLRRT